MPGESKRESPFTFFHRQHDASSFSKPPRVREAVALLNLSALGWCWAMVEGYFQGSRSREGVAGGAIGTCCVYVIIFREQSGREQKPHFRQL